MVRGFVSGLIWGGVVASAGLAVVSQIAPLPQSAETASTPEISPEAPTPAEPLDHDSGPSEPAPVAPPSGEPEPEPASPVAEDPVPDVMARAPDAVDPTAPDAPKAPAAPGLPPARVASADAAPETPAVPAPSDTTAAADPMPPKVDLPPPPPPPPLDEALIAPVPDAAERGAAVPDAEVAETGTPPGPAKQEEAAPLPQIAEPESPEPAPLVPTESPADEGMASDLPALPGEAADLLPDADPSVATDRLPRIGAEDPLPDVEIIAEDAMPLRPIEAFARPFENPDNKPLFAILLADDGSADLDRETLAALPFPVTFVVDPLSPGAAEAAAIYRSGMKEVIFAASGLPAGATAADAEQTFQSHALAVPETVAVIDLPAGGFQDDRTISAAVLTILAEQGRGLLTYDRGLNAADQIARREGIPSATIFRRLDAEGESTPTMRRYLDRAAFRAAQEGEVVVIGSTRPETVAALLEWTVEGRAASVALAPVSAVLTRP